VLMSCVLGDRTGREKGSDWFVVQDRIEKEGHDRAIPP